MRKWLIPSLSIAVLLCTGIGQVRADTLIDTTTAWNGSNNANLFGVDSNLSGSTTYGQVITVPTNGNTLLVSFGFEMDVPTDLIFRAEVFAWNSAGTVATGTSLYQSGQTSTSSFTAGGGSGYQLVTFTPPSGGVNLTAGQQYILMITCSVDFVANILENPTSNPAGAGDGYVGSPNSPADAYTGAAGGAPSTPSQDLFYSMNDDGDTTQWTDPTTTQWQNGTKFSLDNLAFKADFSAGSGAVPLPPALPAGVMGLAAVGGLLGLRRLRTSV